jgi:hypothetical protein
MLHVTNGDAAAEAIRSIGVDGAVLVWRDVLHEGPVPAAASAAELREVRAAFIARSGWGELSEVRADFAGRDARLAAALDSGEEVVLWFEGDLFDQLQLLQTLDRIATARRRSRVTLVPTEGYLGLMSAGELMGCLARALDVAEPLLELARSGWAAFRSEDPRALERLLESGELAPMPDLAAAFERHLEQFPGTRDGLSRSERQAVAALAGGVLPFEELFDRSQRDEGRRFLGDVVLRSYLARLASPPAPLVVSDDAGESWRLTDVGRRVLEGTADRLTAAPCDRWLGGVRLLSPHRVWRWDVEARRLRAP